MSFSRWGPNSDLYVFDHAGHNAVVCQGCPLMPEQVYPGNGIFGPEVQNDDFVTKDLTEMLEHVARHRVSQDNVPMDLERKLIERWPYNV